MCDFQDICGLQDFIIKVRRNGHGFCMECHSLLVSHRYVTDVEILHKLVILREYLIG